MNEYCVIDDLRDYLGHERSDGDLDTVRILGETASRQIDRWCGGRRFYPRLETRYYDHPDDDTVSLYVDDDLLAVTTFTTDNTATTISSADWDLMAGDSLNDTPYNRIRLRSDGTTTSLGAATRVEKANALTATWGYHDDYSNAWENSGDTVQDASMTAAQTTVTVSDALGEDAYGLVPRFKTQQLLRIDSEYVYVQRVTPTILTIKRGVNGTTAATHTTSTTIYIWRPMTEVVNAAKELAKFLYHRRESQTDGDVMAFPESGMVQMPQGLPITVKWFVETYRRRR